MKYIAHRGYQSENAKENTMASFFNAYNSSYFSGIEIDVRETKDKKLVICHDQTINRTSNGVGFIKKKLI